MRREDVVDAARFALGWWDSTPDEATANRSEEQVSRIWRSQLERSFPGSLSFEVEPVPESARSRIDAVDYATSTAYEFKVSGKNPHHRFFRDIWKVAVLNSGGGRRITKLVFLVGSAGATDLADSFTRSVRQVAKASMGIDVEIVGVLPRATSLPSSLDD
jgi:hypothetical protein